MTVIPEETDEDLELEQEFSKVPVPAADTCDMPYEETCEVWAPLEVQQLPTVEQVRVALVATSSTSNMPTIFASSSAASPISSPILKITRGTYKGSSCTVGTLYSQNGGGTNPGGVMELGFKKKKKKHKKKNE
jgi:hypothetical protein